MFLVLSNGKLMIHIYLLRILSVDHCYRDASIFSTGFQTAILMFPINLLIISIFRNCKSRHQQYLMPVYLNSLYEHLTGNSCDYEDTKFEEEDPHIVTLQTSPSTEFDSFIDMRQYYRYSFRNNKVSTVSDDCPSQSDIKLSKNLGREQSSGHRHQPLLPWWCVYIGWTLIVLVSFICAFFTILYTFNYGLETSIKWLGSLFLAFASDAFFAQPLKVLVIALLLSMIFKRSTLITIDNNINLRNLFGK